MTRCTQSAVAPRPGAFAADDRRAPASPPTGRSQHDIQDIFNNRWSTENSGCSALITEVKRLAIASSLVPKSTAFTRMQVPQVQRGGREDAADDRCGITFTVQGNYQQVRRLINLLELSEQFVIVDQIGLSSADTAELDPHTAPEDAVPRHGARRAEADVMDWMNWKTWTTSA